MARFNGYKYREEWCKLSVQEQMEQIAEYRLIHHTEAVLNKDAIDKQKAAQKK